MFLFFGLFFVCCASAGSTKVSEKIQDGAATPRVFEFMKKFGYLESGTDSEAIYTKEAFSEIVKMVQRFGALPQTGLIDNKTLELMESPRCGVPDVFKPTSGRAKRYVITSQKWKKRHLTFFVSNAPSYLSKEEVVRVIQLGLDTWGRYGGLTFSRVDDPDADIIVLFARGPHGDSFNFDGPGNILAHAYYPNSGLGGDVHFDDDETWTTNDDQKWERTDLFSVAVHELGHSLGLGHSDVKNSIMFPYYKEPVQNFRLDYDDILAMYELYHRRRDESSRGDDRASRYPERTTRPYYEPTGRPNRPKRPDYTKKPSKPKYTTTKTPVIPDICEGRFDAVSMIRGELFVFKGEYLWRLREKQQILPGFPSPFRNMFPELPEDVKRIDATYERPDGIIILFTGNRYWKFDGRRFVDSPRPITDYGFPYYLDKIDAAQNWKVNGKTYFYKKDRFWRYNETSRTMDNGYPKNMNRWRGVPHDLDAALTWKDGRTYFFKGKLYWAFDNKWIITTEESPLPAPESWIGCPEDQEVLNYLSEKLDQFQY
ncbi:matrix metalloproteinase-25-like [Agrilus planipennis]|uniref:Matrix metalloproteinase-25-like n=1 Tax=Agrilus planipennis TaxID=224129 RepID=A0A1W4XAM5_AGRPL|nr:matrix metalloproteinase-25-like [Agrilus planipennis]